MRRLGWMTLQLTIFGLFVLMWWDRRDAADTPSFGLVLGMGIGC
jgi:hypothetical protein